MQDGLTLTYRAGKSEVQVDFSDVRTMGEITQGTLHLRHKGKDGTTEAVCGPDGIHTQLGGIEGAALDLSGMDVTVLSSEGVAMPPPDQMVEGATWTNTLALELTPPKLKDAAIARMKTTFKKVATIEGREKVRAAGRVWDALRVKNRITAMAGTAGERTMESTLWIARGVGILKIQTGDTVDLELLSVKHLPKAGRAQKRAR
ncbi:MAG: hypothetical protein IRZ16_16780 [Myxococcaceae bacterium]|nr:hypothetical protein [Myxococcaceae bacterium]